MKVASIAHGLSAPVGQDVVIDLFQKYSGNGNGAVGGNIPGLVKRYGLKPTLRAWDFAAIALSAVAADETVTRSTSPDGWTRQIELTVSVAEPSFWMKQVGLLNDILSFLTGDIWDVAFVAGGTYPKPPAAVPTRKEDVVCLLSGGLDSLVGAIDLVKTGAKPLLVSQVSKGDKKKQSDFAREIASGCLHVQMNHNAKPFGQSERSQRGRSLGFLAFGALAATSTEVHTNSNRIRLVVPENGFISVNAPLTPLRLGSLSTRTTHPVFFGLLGELFNRAGLLIDIENPYQYKTKGQMLCECQDQLLLEKLAHVSTSCGRYTRTGYRHCGRCVPCLVRQAAFLQWGKSDHTANGYKYSPLSQDDAKHRNFTDVRAVAVAAKTLSAVGIEKWIGGALVSVNPADRTALLNVVKEGIGELENFLRHEKII